MTASETEGLQRGARSGVIRWDGGRLADVPGKAYKPEDGSFAGIVRRLIAAPESSAFDVRYFEIEPAGYSSLEHHRHVHVVLCIRGHGTVRLDDGRETVGPGDIVCIAPDTVHQFRNAGTEPFGFFCIVDRRRDPPIPVKED